MVFPRTFSAQAETFYQSCPADEKIDHYFTILLFFEHGLTLLCCTVRTVTNFKTFWANLGKITVLYVCGLKLPCNNTQGGYYFFSQHWFDCCHHYTRRSPDHKCWYLFSLDIVKWAQKVLYGACLSEVCQTRKNLGVSGSWLIHQVCSCV
jgi:hypothetical protein